MKRTHLCGAAHNKSCFITAESHPLSVYNHRSRLNRRGNTIPFCSGVSLIYRRASATLVCGYEPGEHPQRRRATPARPGSYELTTPNGWMGAGVDARSSDCRACLFISRAPFQKRREEEEEEDEDEEAPRQTGLKEDKSLSGISV